MLKDGVRAVIRKDSYPIPPIFILLAKKGEIEEQMMYNTFNMGIGMVVAVDAADARRRWSNEVRWRYTVHHRFH